nr:YceI family protein [uncultured Rhodoferax sp.]
MLSQGKRLWLPATLLACIAMLVGCTAAPTGPGPGETVASPAAVQATAASPSATRYRLDPAASTLHILVYRGGPMARLGHNHVVSSKNLRGSVWQGPSLESSGFDITVPVNDLVMDDNDARAAEGEDFPLNVSEDAKQGTKANMLRDTLLDGARYPEIRITSVRVQGDAHAPVVIAALRIRDQTRQVTVPVTLQTTDGALRVVGRFEVKQSDFGITPLSIAMGALLVVDAVTIKFDLLARTD